MSSEPRSGVVIERDLDEGIDFSRTFDASPTHVYRTTEASSAMVQRIARPDIVDGDGDSAVDDSQLYAGDVDSDTDFDETHELILPDFEEGSSNASFAAPWISDHEDASEGTNEDSSEVTIAVPWSSDDEGRSDYTASVDTRSPFATSSTPILGSDDLSEFHATGDMSYLEDDEAASATTAVTAVTARDTHVTDLEAVPSGAAVFEYRVPRTDDVTAAGRIEAADEQFRSEQVTTNTDWIDRLEVLIPDNIIEDHRKLASHLPRERAWSLRVGNPDANGQQVDAISSVTAEQQATSEYLVLSRKATRLALRSLQDQNILNKDMQISESFEKSMKSLHHDNSASVDDSNEHPTVSPKTPERIISKGGVEARATAPTSPLKLKQGCTTVNLATKRMTSKMSRSAFVACSITARALGRSARICKRSLKRCIKASAITCATSVRGQRIMAIALLRLTKRATSFAGFASTIAMKGLFKLTVHTATAIACIFRVAIVDAPPAIREFMRDVIEEAHALEEARPR
ncbi:hypothetical protein LTR95_010243 [Oleoguttula sp. CCFEE 5521]